MHIFLEYVPGGSIASLLSEFGQFDEILVRVCVDRQTDAPLIFRTCIHRCCGCSSCSSSAAVVKLVGRLLAGSLGEARPGVANFGLVVWLAACCRLSLSSVAVVAAQ